MEGGEGVCQSVSRRDLLAPNDFLAHPGRTLTSRKGHFCIFEGSCGVVRPRASLSTHKPWEYRIDDISKNYGSDVKLEDFTGAKTLLRL